MAVDESDFWGQLTLAPMSSFSQFGVGEGGRNVFDALAQLFALVTTVRLFGPFPQVFNFFPPALLKMSHLCHTLVVLFINSLR